MDACQSSPIAVAPGVHEGPIKVEGGNKGDDSGVWDGSVERAQEWR